MCASCGNVVQRVVLLFDADAGGNTGVDRALEVFVRQNLDLRIAGLPDGLDPCDLLVQQGPEPLKQALAKAVDVFEFKLRSGLAAVAGRHRRPGTGRRADAWHLGPDERVTFR